MSIQQKKILLIGPTKNRENSELTGGSIILFEHLINQYNKYSIDYDLIDTNKRNYNNIIVAYIKIYYQILTKAYNVNHISIHSSKDYLYLAPILIIIGKIFNKKISLRKFGGEAWSSYQEAKGFKKIILKFIFSKVDYLFLEMKFLVNSFKEINPNSYWFPNVRNRAKIDIKQKKFSKKFVFISYITQAKGIDEIIEVNKLLDSSYTIDIYGRIDESKYSQEYFKKHKISYKGVLLSEEVLQVLSTYDVLLLPSWKEGYPGIIIESYSVGIPIIATNLVGISEITDAYKSGILVEPKNIKALKNAIEYFNTDNYEKMSSYAKSKFTLFDVDNQSKNFIELVNSSFS